MARNSYLLLSAAMVTGCASSTYPLIETADQSVTVRAPRVAEMQTLDQFSALEHNNLDTVEQHGVVGVAANTAVPMAVPAPGEPVPTTYAAISVEPMEATEEAPEAIFAAAVAAAENMESDPRARSGYFTDILPLDGRTGADAMTAAQVRYVPKPVMATVPKPVSLAEVAPAAGPEISDVPMLAAIETEAPQPVEPAAIQDIIEGRAAPVAVARNELPAAPAVKVAATKRDFIRRLDPAGRTGADALTAAQVWYQPEEETQPVISADASTKVLPNAVLAEAVDEVIGQAVADPSATEPVVIAGRLDPTGRTGADALTAAQVRYDPDAEPSEGDQDPDELFLAVNLTDNAVAPMIVASIITGEGIVSTRTLEGGEPQDLNTEGRTGADALTAAQVRYEPASEADAAMTADVPQGADSEITDVSSSVENAITGRAAPDMGNTADGTISVEATTDGTDAMSATAETQDTATMAAQRALAEVNALRTANGLPPLALNQTLNAAARAHVIDLAARGEVSALDGEGRGIGERLVAAGYDPLTAGSLVSGGYAKFSDALDSWLKNDVQRSRLMIESADEMGFAIISDRRSTYGIYMEAIIASSTGSDDESSSAE